MGKVGRMGSIIKSLNPKQIGKTIEEGFKDRDRPKPPISKKLAKRFKRQSKGSIGLSPAFGEALGYKSLKKKTNKRRKKR